MSLPQCFSDPFSHEYWNIKKFEKFEYRVSRETKEPLVSLIAKASHGAAQVIVKNAAQRGGVNFLRELSDKNAAFFAQYRDYMLRLAVEKASPRDLGSIVALYAASSGVTPKIAAATATVSREEFLALPWATEVIIDHSVKGNTWALREIARSFALTDKDLIDITRKNIESEFYENETEHDNETCQFFDSIRALRTALRACQEKHAMSVDDALTLVMGETVEGRQFPRDLEDLLPM